MYGLYSLMNCASSKILAIYLAKVHAVKDYCTVAANVHVYYQPTTPDCDHDQWYRNVGE